MCAKEDRNFGPNMNRTVFYKDVPTRRYFLRPRNASVMVNSEFRSDEDDMLNPLVSLFLFILDSNLLMLGFYKPSSVWDWN